ncbi:PCI domain-containing protein 2 [Plectropomus leopardus]|uniref:PCI domain-containing protein 2 n=1 Tax=Plectropomus leopardus TaxID=160734 RepID=UPI001C4BCE2F|nr:PCI domain-containing protein 2 [Plectropomus leopardus]
MNILAITQDPSEPLRAPQDPQNLSGLHRFNHCTPVYTSLQSLRVQSSQSDGEVLFQGHMPTHQLLRKYDLMQFADVTRAVSEGNLLLLNEALSKHETFFIRCGIFLILEKLRIITYRNLFKKVYLLLRTHQLPLDAFLVALKMMQLEDVDIDEVQCILANLIYVGHIKGYISHQHQKLVVSKQNPFPPLSSVS